MECWGAQGGHDSSPYDGGKGAYTSGVLNITESLILYVYVGKQGLSRRSESSSSTSHPGGWNGGGSTTAGSSGGGATDIRLTSGAWNNFNSLKSRIMVAASGGGADNSKYGTNAGALTGIKGDGNGGGAGTQTAGGASGASGASAGGFGYGGSGADGGGSGSGYYGGGGGGPSDNSMGGSGSCFISGHSGCNAISSSSNSSSITHTGSPNHYSGKIFTNTIMKAGNTTQTKPGGGTETGHSGNGYARITLTRW